MPHGYACSAHIYINTVGCGRQVVIAFTMVGFAVGVALHRKNRENYDATYEYILSFYKNCFFNMDQFNDKKPVTI